MEAIDKIAADARAEENEACAKVVEEGTPSSTHTGALKWLAEAIRERKEQGKE